MEGLSRLITSAKQEGQLQGLNILEHCILTHLLFVDDVLIFLNGGLRDSTTFFDILLLFSTTIGMEENQLKSTITLSACTPQEARVAL